MADGTFLLKIKIYLSIYYFVDEMVLLLENVIKNEKMSFIGTNAPLASFPGLFSLGMRLVCVYEANIRTFLYV